MQDWQLVASGAGVVLAVSAITRIMLTGAVKSIKEHCDMQKNACERRMACIEGDDQDQWSAINKHGHKDLQGNGNKVTR